MQADLGSGVVVKQVDRPQYDGFRKIHEPIIFPNRFDINCQSALSDNEKSAIDALGANLDKFYDLRLGFFSGD